MRTSGIFGCLYDIFASRFPDFPMAFARQKTTERALYQYAEFSALGDLTAARINRKLGSELTPFRSRLLARMKEGTVLRRVAPGEASNPKLK